MGTWVSNLQSNIWVDFQSKKIKQLIVSHAWGKHLKPLQHQSTCYQSPIQMDPHSIQEAKLNNTLHQILPQHNQVLHLKSHQYQILHLNPQQQTGWRLFFKCRKPTPSASRSLNVYLMERHHNTKGTSSPISEACYSLYHRFRTEVSHSCHTQVLEVCSSSGSPQ